MIRRLTFDQRLRQLLDMGWHEHDARKWLNGDMTRDLAIANMPAGVARAAPARQGNEKVVIKRITPKAGLTAEQSIKTRAVLRRMGMI